MEIPYSKWYAAIEKRRSYRQFDPNRAIEPEILVQLDKVCKQFKPFPHARTILVTESTDLIFKGLVGNYGKIRGATILVAFIGDMDSASVQEEVGYTGEGIVLEATALGLNTCWVGGAFNRKNAAAVIGIKDNEEVLAISPIGYALKSESLESKVMTGFGRNHKRRPLSKLIIETDIDEVPAWMKTAIEAARLAPSAINRQPWGFSIEADSITVFERGSGIEFNVSYRLDCGISMLHIEVSALNSGYKGEWEFLNSPEVAKYKVPA